MSKQKPKLVIIDGHAVIHRSFHALPPTMTLKDGTMVNAVYGFTTALFKTIQDLKPDYLVLTLDAKGKTFRHEEFEEYKAKRVKAPDELYAQIPLVKRVAKAFDIPMFEVPGFEADDLIGTIVKKTDGQVEKVIVTGDMDAFQLVDEHTKVYKFGRGIQDATLYDAESMRSHYALSPEMIIDYKAICGDSSDNIPGVRGIGDKGAKTLLEEFGDLDNIYKNLDSDKIKDRTRKLLKEHKEEAYMSRDLATIKTDVDIDFDLEKTELHTYDQEEISKLFRELEFRSLLPRLSTLNNQGIEKNKKRAQDQSENKFKRNDQDFNYKLIDTEKDFKNFFTQLKKQKAFTFDTETTTFDPLDCSLLGISFSWKKGEAYYVNFKGRLNCEEVEKEMEQGSLFDSQVSGVRCQLSENDWLEKFNTVFKDEKIKKRAHNGKFDIRVLNNSGIDVNGFDFDTMIASYVLSPGGRQHGLDALTLTELGFNKISKDDLLGRGRDKRSFAEVEADKLANYSCEDADFTNRLVAKLKPQLKDKGVLKLFKDLEIPLIKVLAQMEDNGIELNEKFLSVLGEKMDKQIVGLEKKIHKQAGMEFNIASPKQLQKVLFDKLEIPADGIKKTKTGISTSADELDKMVELHPIIKMIQEYRELSKLTSTYIHALPRLVNKRTGRLHTSFNQTVAATGRLSSSDPNLQNIPIRTQVGREIRKAFIAGKGYKLLALDYSQIELRLAAHMSGDPKMIKAFHDRADIHTMTAAEINQVSPEAVDEQMRREAKAVNFGILYGQGPHGLSRGADIPYYRAKEFIDQYFEVYKDIKKFMDRAVNDAREKGYAETLLGRRRYLPELESSVVMVRKGAERMAINTPLQGTAADMIKKAMIEIYNSGINAHMLLQVHDELIFAVKPAEAKKAAEEIKQIMENVIKLKVPVVVDAKLGDNWGEMEEIRI